jgi:hypothetical protein
MGRNGQRIDGHETETKEERKETEEQQRSNQRIGPFARTVHDGLANGP